MTQAFNLSQLANNVNTSGQLNAAAGLYNQVAVANGGTGVASVASGNILVGAGTAAMTALAGGTAGFVLTWNGTAWVSSAGAGGPAPVVTIYTSPATWSKPASLKAVKVTVIGGGGGGAVRNPSGNFAVGGGAGGVSIANIPASPSVLPGPVTVTVGNGGAATTISPTPGTASLSGNAGFTSSFGALVTATGGGGGPNPAGPAVSYATPGAGTSTLSSSTLSSPYVAGFNSLTYPTQVMTGTQGPLTPANAAPGQYVIGLNLLISANGPGSGFGYGTGGSAATGTGSTSFAGQKGLVVVEEFY